MKHRHREKVKVRDSETERQSARHSRKTQREGVQLPNRMVTYDKRLKQVYPKTLYEYVSLHGCEHVCGSMTLHSRSNWCRTCTRDRMSFISASHAASSGVVATDSILSTIATSCHTTVQQSTVKSCKKHISLTISRSSHRPMHKRGSNGHAERSTTAPSACPAASLCRCAPMRRLATETHRHADSLTRSRSTPSRSARTPPPPSR